MLIAVLSGFGLSLVAPLIHRLARGAAGWLIALLPLALTLYFASFIGPIAGGEAITESYPWVASLGVTLSFYLDGLSLLFALIISGVGVMVIVYAGGYLRGHEQLGRFYLYILIFMASMLGLVLAANVLTLFIFWELTSVSSYLLIGFYHDKEASRKAALRALLVTGIGGLVMLAGLVLLGLVGGSFEIADLLANAEAVRADALYVPLLVLILVGAFTKSAQVPFHFWLPGAMEAPAPVSAYLHSATMVKAGVYLLARLSPVLGGTGAWTGIVGVVGGLTMVVGAYLALRHSDLKRILAYTTVSALGMLTFLLGLGSTYAVKAAMVFLLTHALYKGALFLASGSVDHESGTRDVNAVGGLARLMPVTALVTGLAALSMSGLPPFFGFISKELTYEATLTYPDLSLLLTAAALLTNIFTVTAAGVVAIRPFFGPKVETPKKPHEAPPSMLLGPAALAALGLAAGVVPHITGEWLIAPAVSAVLAEPTAVKLALWHGVNAMLALSVVTILGGIGLYMTLRTFQRYAARVDRSERWGPARWYEDSVDGLLSGAEALTRVLQHGYLRFYLLTIVVTTMVLVGGALVTRSQVGRVLDVSEVRLHEAVIAVIILAAIGMVVTATSRLVAVVALGVIGYGVAMLFVFFSAPDLAMTQFAVETLTVILFVLVLYRLPRFARLSSQHHRSRDMVIAATAGILMTAMVLLVLAQAPESRLAAYFTEASVPEAQGRNIVNVILVDFRVLDTLGEIVVIGVAALGVFALLMLRLERAEVTRYPHHGPTAAGVPVDREDAEAVDAALVRESSLAVSAGGGATAGSSAAGGSDPPPEATAPDHETDAGSDA